MLTKQQWLDRAEVIDAYRVFPRLLLLSAFLFLCWYSWYALQTIICLADRMSGLTQGGQIVQAVASGVIAVTVPMIGSMFGKVADLYLNTGRRWA